MKTLLSAVVLLLGFAIGTVAADSTEAVQVYRDPARLAKLVADQERPYLLVDVRTPEEYTSGHIPTAVNVPVAEIKAGPPTEDKAALVIVYCASGARSARAREILVGLGYTSVVDFGSVSRWTGALVRGPAPDQSRG